MAIALVCISIAAFGSLKFARALNPKPHVEERTFTCGLTMDVYKCLLLIAYEPIGCCTLCNVLAMRFWMGQKSHMVPLFAWQCHYTADSNAPVMMQRKTLSECAVARKLRGVLAGVSCYPQHRNHPRIPCCNRLSQHGRRKRRTSNIRGESYPCSDAPFYMSVPLSCTLLVPMIQDCLSTSHRVCMKSEPSSLDSMLFLRR
jgi:hypothetical protein